jgi:hypothetical protein
VRRGDVSVIRFVITGVFILFSSYAKLNQMHLKPNVHAYAGDDPIDFSDPFGLEVGDW